MSTATMTRPAVTNAPVTPTAEDRLSGRERAIAAVAIGSASALTLGIFGWAVWVASQISIPI